MSQTVEVSLPSSTLYVSGTVNGVSVVWTNTTGNTWQAEAARAADDIYMLELSVVDENGGANYMSLVLFYGGLNLVTDRTDRDVARWKELKAKGWSQMTVDEQAEWMGDPMVAAKTGKVVNLLNMEIAEVVGASLNHVGDEITISSLKTGAYLYARAILGPAEHFVNQTITISCADAEMEYASSFSIQAFWVDEGLDYTDYTFVSGSRLKAPGALTFRCNDNPVKRKYLAIYIYVAADESLPAGTTITYKKVMVELGSTAHEYVPYVPFVLTPALKGMYSYRDMNRVEGAVKLLSEHISALGYLYHPEVKTNWSNQDIPTKADMDRYFGNVAGFRDVMPLYPSTPKAPDTGENLDYIIANDLEKILLDVNRIADSIPNSWYATGEVYSGEV